MAASDRYRSLIRLFTGVHSIPFFEGRNSRRHQDVALWKLWVMARVHMIFGSSRFSSAETFVQFVGFPRSGHSLIGSILDAHPQARISHELDAMGLFKKGFSQACIFALIDKKSAEFTRHGRCWNGFSYLVPEGHHGGTANLRLIGDKKGDATLRWIARDPSVLDKLREKQRTVQKWILVVRNPFDNIATMSLRKGRAYDDLKTSIRDRADFQKALKKQQDEDIIAREALDTEIDEYASLCKTIEKMKDTTSPDNWFELSHEEFAGSPETALKGLLSFLDLPAHEDYVKNCCRLVNTRSNPSRNRLHWPKAKRARVDSLIRKFSFLNRYEKDDDAWST